MGKIIFKTSALPMICDVIIGASNFQKMLEDVRETKTLSLCVTMDGKTCVNLHMDTKHAGFRLEKSLQKVSDAHGLELKFRHKVRHSFDRDTEVEVLSWTKKQNEDALFSVIRHLVIGNGLACVDELTIKVHYVGDVPFVMEDKREEIEACKAAKKMYFIEGRTVEFNY